MIGNETTQVGEAPAPTFNASAEKNSKGWNYSATVVNARTPEEALKLLVRLTEGLARQYGGGGV